MNKYRFYSTLRENFEIGSSVTHAKAVLWQYPLFPRNGLNNSTTRYFYPAVVECGSCNNY